MRQDTITLSIEEKFTPEQKTEIADQMASAVAEIETIASEKKVSDAAFKERSQRFEKQLSDLAHRYNKGCEVAQIGCDIRYDHPEPGKKSYVRMDTGELVETHDMSWEEKQETIQFPLTANPDNPTQAQPTDEQVSDALKSVSSEITHLCTKTPGCIHFADHDGPCELPPPAEPPCQEQPGAND